mgnify:CR=1 FL=1
MERDTRIVRVAAAQIAIGGEIEANVRAISEAMRQSADRGAMLGVFPETAITGYSPDLGRGRPPEDWPAVQAALATTAVAVPSQPQAARILTLLAISARSSIR